MTADQRRTTPTLIETLNLVIDKHLCDLHTAMPAEVISYDHAKNLAVVQPVLKRKYKSEDSAVDLPTISDVVVCFQRMGAGHLRLPVNPGDTGQLVFNERSIDGWLQSGGKIDPLDPRKHSLSDAVFYPGLNPNSKAMESSAANDSLELKLNGAYIEITGAGKFKITNGTEELISLLVDTMTEMIDEMNEQGALDFTNTIFGPQQPVNAAKYTTLKGKYTTLKTKLESLKG